MAQRGPNEQAFAGLADFDGTGQVSLQTRNARSLAASLHPLRPVKSKG